MEQAAPLIHATRGTTPDTSEEPWAAAEVRHELTNGLAALLVAAETLRDRRPALSETALDGVVELVLARVQRLRHVLAELEPDVTPPPTPVDLRDVPLRALVRSAASTLHEEPPGLVLDVDEHLAVRADADRLTTVVRQLLAEADAHGHVAARQQDGWVLLTVQDAGLDVDPGGASPIPSPHADGDARAAGPGRGFGLVAVRPLVSSMGGRVDVEADERGARVTLRLRAASAPADDAPAPPADRTPLDELTAFVLDRLADGGAVLVLSTARRLGALRERVAAVDHVAAAIRARRLRLLDADVLADELLPAAGRGPGPTGSALGVLVHDLVTAHGHAAVHSELEAVLRERGAERDADNVSAGWDLLGETHSLDVVAAAPEPQSADDRLFTRVLRALAAERHDA